VLRTYSLGSTNTLYVDTGTYLIHGPVLISNTVGVGDDEGFSLVGPVNSSHTALHRFANPLDMLPMFDLDNADFVSFSNVSAENGGLGLWLHNITESFNGSSLSFSGMQGDGVFIDLGSAALTLDRVVSQGNGGVGIHIDGDVGTISNALVADNMDDGIEMTQDAPGAIQNTIVYDTSKNGIE